MDQFSLAFSSDKFDIIPHIIALGVAYILAFPIGWHREKTERSAGLRTFPLVAMSACAFVQASEVIMSGNADATAGVVEGVITGMGFIDGGAILKVKNSVQGTATAASLWATGAIGIAAGVGALDVAVMTSVVTILTLLAFSRKEAEATDTSAEEGESD